MRQPLSLELCSQQCTSKCCRAPFVLHMTRDEALAVMTANPVAAENVRARNDGDLIEIRMVEQPGYRCPFLDGDNACTVYDVRPKPCRNFPIQPHPLCLAWPNDDEAR